MVSSLQQQLTHGPEECPGGWTRHLDTCYLVTATNSSWYEAQYQCGTLHRRAQLAIVPPSAGELTERMVTDTVSGTRGAWIGMTRLQESDDTFGWIDGTQPVATRFSPNEPNGDGDCVHIWGPEPGWTTEGGVAHGWNDLPCHYGLNILCEIQLK
ncbi:Perlucin-like protein [Amphibalanus amphitrite]|uniref:Perlucin-like protein n=1 Tax=Amphibalanus amphitrite TaxID=1232801 RepID=A0A6A4W6S6_AMPAM|nr:perlucin-like protein [Amphibalanus amphitrite]KAF0299434.1 Perlucin-like protein [Amphibalanus amphitrite]